VPHPLRESGHSLLRAQLTHGRQVFAAGSLEVVSEAILKYERSTMNPKQRTPGNATHRLTPAESEECRYLVAQVTARAREVLRECGEPELSRSVIEAMLRVPRARFVPPHHENLAYANTALSIGHGQTISQPLIVALMTHLLRIDPAHTILEVGTGSGYQAAVLGELAKQVYTVEVIPALGAAAGERLEALGYDNVRVRIGDGCEGWPEHAPYDGIIVTAATPEIPTELVNQLRPGARLVIPLGAVTEVQWLSVVHELGSGECTIQRILPVRFVPLTGGNARFMSRE
jgi:protein-L-isoaspartate(D-aspartate) O-methyltransferase